MRKIIIAFLATKALLIIGSAISNPDILDVSKDVADLTKQVVLLCMDKKKRDETE